MTSLAYPSTLLLVLDCCDLVTTNLPPLKHQVDCDSFEFLSSNARMEDFSLSSSRLSDREQQACQEVDDGEMDPVFSASVFDDDGSTGIACATPSLSADILSEELNVYEDKIAFDLLKGDIPEEISLPSTTQKALRTIMNGKKKKKQCPSNLLLKATAVTVTPPKRSIVKSKRSFTKLSAKPGPKQKTIATNQSAETTCTQLGAVTKPTDRDVLCGKGGKTLMHNRHFTNLCNELAISYSSTKKRGINGKKGIAFKIVQEIKKSHGRFLKPQDAGMAWEEISDEHACNKVAHCIRDIIRRLKNP